MSSVTLGKTPITVLQEWATKHAITPQYDLIANEGAVHEPTFIVRVSVGESVNALGKGSSKKKAKHAAAQSALNQIMGIKDEDNVKDDNEVTAQTNPDKDDESRHPVGELQEFTQKKLLKPPIYEFVSDNGAPHNREYVCNIKLGKYSEKGTGRSKKSAKRDAASKMLTMLQSLASEKGVEKEIEDSEEEEDIPLEGFKKSVYSGIKREKKVMNPQSSEEILKFYEKVMVAGGKQIRSNGQSVSTPITNYCQMLQEIAEVQRFEVQYFDIKDKSTNGLNQCLVQMSTIPVAVCQGTGPVMDEAHANAAHNALQYLKIMIK